MPSSIRHASRRSCAASLLVASVVAAHAFAADPLALEVTVGTDLSANACAATKAIAVVAGTEVNACYRVTNRGTTPLAYSSLEDEHDGVLLRNEPVAIAPGETVQFNRYSVATRTRVTATTWSARAEFPDYGVEATSADRVFGDAFESAPSPTYAFEDIASTGTPLALGDDDTATVDIGFDFDFWGARSRTVRIGNNGGILFGTAIGGVDFEERPLPDATLRGAILPYWDDLSADTGEVFVETRGTAPNRRFVVQWNDRSHYDDLGNGSGTATFEAILSEGSDAIDFVYADTTFDVEDWDSGASAAVGLNYDGTLALPIAFDEARIVSGTALHFAPLHPDHALAADVVSVVVGAPAITVTPPSLDVQLPSNGTETRTLVVGNVGDATLSWSAGTASSTAHMPIVSRLALPLGDPAKSSFGPAPPTGAIAKRAAKPRLPFDAAVPAFGVHYGGFDRSDLLSFDAAAPDTQTLVAENLQSPVARRFFYGADFVDGDFSAVLAVDNVTHELVAVDTHDGTQTVIGAFDIADQAASGFKQDPASGRLYLSTIAPDGSVSYLYTLDRYTAAATLVGAIENAPIAIDIAFDADGRLYALDIANDALVAVDKATGAGSVIGSIGFDANFAQGLAFDFASNTLYLAGYDGATRLAGTYTLDLGTGAATLISPFDPSTHFGEVDAFAIAHAAPCVQPSAVPWLRVAQTAGVTAPTDTDTLDVAFDATALAPGQYRANVCVASDDPERRIVTVPVSLTVP